jgi:hypothetical protein
MFNSRCSRVAHFLAILGSLLMILTACGEAVFEFPDYRNKGGRSGGANNNQTIFSDGGLFGRGRSNNDQGGGGIGVNSFLWRAALDSISFMPIVSADPFGGVIVTDWHVLPEAPNERFKVNLMILGRELRADGVRASVFKQKREGSSDWVDIAVEDLTAQRIENAILGRARELRLAQAQ